MTWLTMDWIADFYRKPSNLDLAGCPGVMRTESAWGTEWRELDQWLCYAFLEGHSRLAWRAARETTVHRQAIGPGTIVWLPPGCTFRFRNAGRRSCRLQRFRFAHAIRPPTWPAIQADLADQFGLMNLLVDEARDPEAPLHGQRATGLLTALFTTCLRRSQQAPGRPRFSPDVQTRLQAYCSDHLGTRPEPRDLARLVGLSEDYFTRLFRATFGLPPRRWLVEQRLAHVAVALTETDLPISAIAQRHGYESLTLMGRQFRQRYGCSPRSYRQARLRDRRQPPADASTPPR